METIAGGRRSEDLGQIGLGPAFAVAIEEQIPGCSVIRKTINELHHVPASFGYVNHMAAACVITFERARKDRRVRHGAS
jgi:hypothetical protein